MLHAPLAKLLTESKGWELTTALNAICHERLNHAARQAYTLTGLGSLDADYHELDSPAMMAALQPGSGQQPRIHSPHIKYQQHEPREFIFI